MTLTVTVEPSFLALTTTPSIAPSASEVTCPVRAAAALLSAAAGCGVACKRMAAELSNEMDKRRRVCIGSSLSVAMGRCPAMAQLYTSRKYAWYNVLRLKSTAPRNGYRLLG